MTLLPREIPAPLRAWAEINAAALGHNITLLQDRFGAGGATRIMAVVKANAYGHDVSLIAPLCARYGLRDFGIATPLEGASLRTLLPPEATIFLLGPAFPEEAPAIVQNRLISLVSDFALGQALSEAALAQGTLAEAHLDIDTAIGRAGVQPADAPGLLGQLNQLPGLRVTGLSTHFASADEDPGDAYAQMVLFARVFEELGERGNSLLVHLANSPATLILPSAAHGRLIRPGLMLYGIEPAPGLFDAAKAPFLPVLSLKAHVTLCRPLPGGATISYGRTYTVPPGGGVYATLGIGYGDGYPRRLSNKGYVLLHGQCAPICGRVCMDQIVVDVSHIPGVQAGDIATLIGTNGNETQTAAALAAAIETTPHEITTCLTARIPRVLREAPDFLTKPAPNAIITP